MAAAKKISVKDIVKNMEAPGGAPETPSEDRHTIEPVEVESEVPMGTAKVDVFVKERKVEDLEKEALMQRLEDMERALTLLMVPQPEWCGYTTEERTWLNEWYAKVRRDLNVQSRGPRD